MDAIVDLLDRQVAYLLRQTDDAWFLVQLDPFLRALKSDALLNVYLEDLTDELVSITGVIEQVDTELVSELIDLRNELVLVRPGADDSGATRPEPIDRSQRTPAQAEYEGTLAFFDEHAAAEPEPFNAEAEGGTAGVLLNILQGKDRLYLMQRDAASTRTTKMIREDDEIREGESITAEQPAAGDDGIDEDRLEAWRRRLGNVRRRYDHARRWMRLRVRTSGGLALLKLKKGSEALNPPIPLLGTDADVVAETQWMLRWVMDADYSLFKLVDGQRLDPADESIVSERVEDLRRAAERLHEDLRRRIGTTRSRLAMVMRFKERCEWHDRERMTRVADDKALGGHPEDRLTAEFARFLFDQGLSPLSKPITGGLQPDLLDPAARFYVEAKQYKKSIRGELVSGIAQIVDTAGRLRTQRYAVEEAFCVVFRRDGPYYDLPERIDLESLRIHLVLIDIAPSEDAGRRQEFQPVRIPESEFVDEYQRQVDARKNESGDDGHRRASDSAPNTKTSVVARRSRLT